MKRFLQTAALCFAIVFALAFAAPALALGSTGAQAYTSAQVLGASNVQATTNVNVRSGPGTSYAKLGTLSKGDVVEKTGVSGSWTKISYNGKTAYVSSQYLKDAAVNSAGYVQATANVNVRSGPGTGYTKLGVLSKGATVPKLGVSGSWTKVSFNNQTAYISSQYLKAASGTGSTGTGSTGTGSTGTGSTGTGSTVTSGFDDSAAMDLINVINGYRAQNGIAKLTVSAALNADAKIRVQEIVQKFSHTRPDGTLCFTVDPANINGENIAMGGGTLLYTGQEAADAFMGSPDHRENAMRTTFTKTGSACLRVNGTNYWVHLFGY